MPEPAFRAILGRSSNPTTLDGGAALARPVVVDQRREQILDGLFVAMAEAGSDAASVTQIAARSGLPRGALHYYFKSKDEMRRALMQRMGSRYVAGLQQVLETHGVEALRKLVRFHFRGDLDETSRLMSVWIDFWGQAPADRELSIIVADVQQRARAVFAQAVRRLRPAMGEAEALTHGACALAVVEGLLLQWRVCRATDRPFDMQAAGRLAEAQVLQLAAEVA